MAYAKIGYHAGVGGNRNGIGDYMAALDTAGIPFCVKSINDGGLIAEAAAYAVASGVKHNIIFRITNPGGASNDLPDYSLDPHPSAVKHWEKVKPAIPPEVTAVKHLVWIEPSNEIDTNEHPGAEWLGWFSYHIAGMMMADGYRPALAGFNAGQPEKAHWKLDGFKKFLELCAANPDRCAVSLHEGKLGDMNAPPQSYYPHLIGRFTWLFEACAEMGIARPPVFISEWAWAYNNMPPVEQAMNDVRWLAELVAGYTAVRGVFLWNLAGGGQWGDLPNKLQKLIKPITDYTLATTFPDPEEPEEPPMDTWQEEVWKLGEQNKVLGFKTGAALQVQITADGYQALSNEYHYTRQDGKELVCQRAKHASEGTFRTYYCIKPDFNTVYVIEADAGTPPPNF